MLVQYLWKRVILMPRDVCKDKESWSRLTTEIILCGILVLFGYKCQFLLRYWMPTICPRCDYPSGDASFVLFLSFFLPEAMVLPGGFLNLAMSSSLRQVTGRSLSFRRALSWSFFISSKDTCPTGDASFALFLSFFLLEAMVLLLPIVGVQIIDEWWANAMLTVTACWQQVWWKFGCRQQFEIWW